MRLMGRVVMPRVDRLARVGSHVLIWSIVLVPTIVEMSRGWQPLLGDDATITLRSYQVLSLHPPLVGMHSTVVHNGHSLYDLGPLQFVLLTIPVHLDHLQGALWGTALIIGLVLSVAVEALWSTGRWMGCVILALATADLAWTAASLFGHQLWNDNFSLIFLLASIALAWVVAIGSFGWWPVLVFTASVTVQAQLFNGLPVVVLVIASPLLGWWRSGRPRRLRWLYVGTGVGIVCWLPTLVQQAFGSFGNVSGTLAARGNPSFGFTFGLRNIGGAVWPGPLPLRQYDLYTSSAWLQSKPALAGIGVLVVLACIAVVAGVHGTKDLACLATIGLVCSASVVVAFASVPRANVGSVTWLVPAVWIVSLLWWLIVVWAVVELVKAYVPHATSWGSHHAPSGIYGMCIGAALVVGLVVGVWKLPSQSSVSPVSHLESAQVGEVVRALSDVVPTKKVTIRFCPTPSLVPFGPEDYVEYQYGQAILWRLTAAGFETRMQPFFTALSGIPNPKSASSRTVNVIMSRDSWSSVVQKVVIGRYRAAADHRRP